LDNFLKVCLNIFYLKEHIIYEWEDKRPKFHEELVLQYITRIKSLLSQFVKLPVNNQFMRSLSSNDENIDNNELVILRRKLRAFLETDKYYTVKDTLKLIEKDEGLKKFFEKFFSRVFN